MFRIAYWYTTISAENKFHTVPSMHTEYCTKNINSMAAMLFQKLIRSIVFYVTLRQDTSRIQTFRQIVEGLESRAAFIGPGSPRGRLTDM